LSADNLEASVNREEFEAALILLGFTNRVQRRKFDPVRRQYLPEYEIVTRKRKWTRDPLNVTIRESKKGGGLRVLVSGPWPYLSGSDHGLPFYDRQFHDLHEALAYLESLLDMLP
jgi:hypothetical protein